MRLSGRSTKARPTLPITQAVMQEIHRTIGSMPAEHGGILGGSRTDGVVTRFHFDGEAQRTRTTYSPNHVVINEVLAQQWNPAGIHLLGFVHSQPRGVQRPSHGDLVYARDILAGIPELEHLLLPIVMTEPDTGRFEMFAYTAVRDGQNVRVQDMELSVIDDAEVEAVTTQVAAAPDAPRLIDLSETFRRVQHAYDQKRLSCCRMVYIGAGGAASFIEDMARTGLGEHVLIEPDVVSEANLATQQVYRKDIGRPKVECIAERIRDINPHAIVVTRQQRLDDIDDAEFKQLAIAPLGERSPEVTLLCGFTDDFAPQARINRLALHFGLPSLCAQVYREGRGAEITYTVPGVTSACHRCVLNSRYQAYQQQGFKNDVTSDGTPLFATTRLNALKGFIVMAILHHSTAHPRWGGLLERIGNRNLIQIRMDPDLDSTLGLEVFTRAFGGGDQDRILFDETVWLPQKPDCPENGYPPCPDCGGTGDLRMAMGTFDTRYMRP